MHARTSSSYSVREDPFILVDMMNNAKSHTNKSNFVLAVAEQNQKWLTNSRAQDSNGFFVFSCPAHQSFYLYMSICDNFHNFHVMMKEELEPFLKTCLLQHCAFFSSHPFVQCYDAQYLMGIVLYKSIGAVLCTMSRAVHTPIP